MPISLSVIAAVICAYLYMVSRALGITLGCVLIVVLAILTAIFILKYKYKKSRLRVAIAMCLSTALSICAFTVAVVSYDNWYKGNDYSGYCTVSGRICAVDVRTGIYRFNLEELVLNGNDVDGMMRVTVTAADNNIAELAECGDTIVFGAKVKTVKLFDNGKVNGNAYRTDIRYTATVSGDSLIIDTGEATALESFLQNMRTFYVDNMGEKYGNIAFSMITGDKYALDEEYTDYFSAAGIGHIMAVSGLHIGFLAIVLSFILSKLDKRIAFPIMLAVLFAYTVIADFSPSVVRAVIMAAISGAAVFIGGRRDLLSSLLCAFSLILAVKPLYLFETGFLLSFGAIFGIALFANSIRRFLVKHGAHHKVGNAIGASVAVSIGIMPIMMYYFETVQIFACIVNIALLPYIALVFLSIVCLTPLALIPHCGVVLKACEYLLMPLDYITYGIAQIPYATIKVSTAAYVLVCYPIMFFASEFFMLRKGKTAVVLYSAAVCVLICIICTL